MRKFLTTLFVTLLFANVTFAQHTYALLVGVSKYDLPAEYDADRNMMATHMKDIKSILSQQKDITVAILTSKNANPQNIKKKLNAIVKLAKSNDKIMFFYGGHGAEGALVCHNGDHLPFVDLLTLLTKAKTPYVFCFLEACHSGSVKDAISKTDTRKVNPVFMTAARDDESSVNYLLTNSSLFLRALTKGLRGKADGNGDKNLTVSELYKYVYNDVREHVKSVPDCDQHPQLIGPSKLFDTVITSW